MIDPESIDAEHYVKISSALVKSGRFIVIDRAAGFNAIKREQERIHRSDVDRFADREKYAHWGKLYGVGGVVVAHADCHYFEGVFKGRYKSCKQLLQILDTNTAEVLAVADGESDGDAGDEVVPWEEVVADLEVAYPKYFEKDKTHAKLEEYKQLSKELATRNKEDFAREQIDAERKLASIKEKAPAPVAPAPAPVAPAPASVTAPKASGKTSAQEEAQLPEQASDVAKERVKEGERVMR
jgi:hypothetical protein